jgi:hypothetical protein
LRHPTALSLYDQIDVPSEDFAIAFNSRWKNNLMGTIGPGFEVVTENDCKFIAAIVEGANGCTIIQRGARLAATIKAAISKDVQPKLEAYLAAEENADTTSASETEAGDTFFDEMNISGNPDESMDSNSSSDEEMACSSDNEANTSMETGSSDTDASFRNQGDADASPRAAEDEVRSSATNRDRDAIANVALQLPMPSLCAISLPPGPIGLSLLQDPISLKCIVVSKSIQSLPLAVGDAIIKLNGIILTQVEGGLTSWIKLFHAFDPLQHGYQDLCMPHVLQKIDWRHCLQNTPSRNPRDVHSGGC